MKRNLQNDDCFATGIYQGIGSASRVANQITAFAIL